MRLLAAIFILLCFTEQALALDVRVNSSTVLVDPILVLITDTAYPPTPLPGQTTSTVTFNYACGGDTVSTLAGVTLTEIDTTNKDGRYWVTSSAALTGCNIPDVITISGGGTDRDVPPVVANLYSNTGLPVNDSSGVTTLLSRIPSTLNITLGRVGLNFDDTAGTLQDADIDSLTVLDSSGITTLLTRIPSALTLTAGNVHAHVKASDPTVGMNYADISGSTSGSSFTIASPVDFQGNVITMTTDFLKNRLVKAYTNGGAPCNVNGQGGWVNTVTSGGLVTLDISTTGSGFTATPNTTNCGVMWAP